MYVQNNYVIGNPNNFEVSKKVDKASRSKTIICVGRFNDYVKRIDRILECFSLVLKDVPDAKLVLVGKYDNDVPIRSNDNATVNDLINNFAIPSDCLSFVGEVSNVQDYYVEARVLLLTSNSEGFGMVLNEAACFGVPSVCNYIPGIEDIITNGENGYITEQGDIPSMALRVSDILNDNRLYKKLSENAKKKVESYDSNHIGNKWRYLINSLIEISDKNELHKTLDSELGYSIQNQQLFSSVLSRELNEIFFVVYQRR
ncbi:glycosyltransferase [Candidatus Saccharibacteria bacterium]|nr:MAG: glycosyltransferase [Candidatus Saccharibacteria bacterium]